MKTRKKQGKKILLIVAAVLLLLLICDIAVTEIGAHKIPHRFASAQEGRELLLANTGYYAGMQQKDLDFRMGHSGATLEELLDASAADIKGFSLPEKLIMDHHIAKMARTLRRNGYSLPLTEEIVYIKTDMTTEGISASGYTHGHEIYLNSVNVLFSVVPGAGEYFDELLWHELFHCLTRNDPEFRSDAYALIGFTVAESDFELPPCARELYFSNPDVEHHDAHASFVIDGRETDCFLAWIFTEDSSSYETTPALIPTDGTDTYYLPDRASNFDDVFGRNTDYVNDPEECLADNFACAMLYGPEGRNAQGYPDPEIILGLIDLMRRS